MRNKIPSITKFGLCGWSLKYASALLCHPLIVIVTEAEMLEVCNWSAGFLFEHRAWKRSMGYDCSSRW